MAKSEALSQIIEALRSRPMPADVTWDERRQAMEAFQAGLTLPDDVRTEPTRVADVPVEWITTPGADSARVILYLHGGGYTLGSPATHRYLMQSVGRAGGARVLGVDYRLAPEAPFPAALDDAVAVWKWLLAEGFEPRSCIIAGDSAGGGLALATLIRLREEGVFLPAGAVCLSPWTDLSASGDSLVTKADEDPMVTGEMLELMARTYLAGEDPLHPLASPLFADLAGLPPLLIQVGSAEILLDDALRLAERARRADVDVTLETWNDMIHVFQAFPSLPETERAVASIGEFVRRRTAATA